MSKGNSWRGGKEMSRHDYTPIARCPQIDGHLFRWKTPSIKPASLTSKSPSGTPALKIRRATDRWLERSDSWIGKHIGCRNITVTADREKLESACQIDKLDSLLGEDGKRYPRTRVSRVKVLCLLGFFALHPNSAAWRLLIVRTPRFLRTRMGLMAQ